MKNKPKSQVVAFTVPPEMKEILDITPETGYYDSLSEFLRDAIRSHLRHRRELAVLIAFRLYKAKRISIGKAAVLANTSLEEIERLFASLEA